MPGGGPVAMTDEQSADDAAAQHAVKSLVLLARLPLGDDLIAFRKAAHVQPLRIRRSTTKASEIRRVSFLDTLHKFYGRYCRGSPLLPPFGPNMPMSNTGGHRGPPLPFHIDDRNCWRSLKRWILPVAVLGNSGPN